VKINVPVNTTATLYLDAIQAIREADSLIFTNDDKSYKAEAGSGEYTVSFTL